MFENISRSNTLTRLIFINVGIFLLIQIIGLIAFFAGTNDFITNIIIYYTAVPADVLALLKRPWTLITYMFIQKDFSHILFNMLWLYWFGQIFSEYLGNRKLLSVYIIGGIAGALLYILSFNLFPVFSQSLPHSFAIGASASILAIVVATATLLPDYKVMLILIGAIPLKYIAIFSVVLDIISIQKGNAGGHIAHLGGALYGFLYIKQLRSGRDIGEWMSIITDKLSSIFSSSSKMNVAYRSTTSKKRPISDEEYIAQKKQKQEIVDRILDKISQSGYDSLTKEEKEILFRASKE